MALLGSGMRLSSSSGWDVAPQLLFFAWLLLVCVTAPWASRIAAVPPADPESAPPLPNLAHFGPHLDRSLQRLIQSARMTAVCLEVDAVAGSRQLWNFTEELRSAPEHVHAFLERCGAPTDFTDGVTSLHALETAICRSDPFGYRR